jgi:hypothetical protein
MFAAPLGRRESMMIKCRDRPRDSERPGHPAAGCGCRLWWWPHRGARAIAKWCGCRCRVAAGEWRRHDGGTGADVLCQTGTAHRHLNGLVDDTGVHMMTPGEARTGVSGGMPGRKDMRPAPCLGGKGVFPYQRLGQVDLAMPRARSC